MKLKIRWKQLNCELLISIFEPHSKRVEKDDKQDNQTQAHSE